MCYRLRDTAVLGRWPTYRFLILRPTPGDKSGNQDRTLAQRPLNQDPRSLELDPRPGATVASHVHEPVHEYDLQFDRRPALLDPAPAAALGQEPGGERHWRRGLLGQPQRHRRHGPDERPEIDRREPLWRFHGLDRRHLAFPRNDQHGPRD